MHKFKHKSMPYGVKKRLLLSNAYYLPKVKFNEMIQEVEHSHGNVIVTVKGENFAVTDMQYCIHMVDTFGDWLNG